MSLNTARERKSNKSENDVENEINKKTERKRCLENTNKINKMKQNKKKTTTKVEILKKKSYRNGDKKAK